MARSCPVDSQMPWEVPLLPIDGATGAAMTAIREIMVSCLTTTNGVAKELTSRKLPRPARCPGAAAAQDMTGRSCRARCQAKRSRHSACVRL